MQNMQITEGSIILAVNPKIYPLETIYSASYVFMDRAYILLDGDPESRITVQIKPKNNCDLEVLGAEFNNELLNYADYQKRAEETKKIRELILQRSLITNDPAAITENDKDFKELLDELDDNEDLDYLDDPEGIAIPWEEKYGKGAVNKCDCGDEHSDNGLDTDSGNDSDSLDSFGPAELWDAMPNAETEAKSCGDSLILPAGEVKETNDN